MCFAVVGRERSKHTILYHRPLMYLSKVAKQTLIYRHPKLVAKAETKRVVFYLQSSSPRVGLSLSLDANRIGGDR